MGQVTQVMNQEFLQAVADFVASQNSSEATQRNTIILILLKKIREVMDEIIQSYPPAIREQANRFLAEVQSSEMSSTARRERAQGQGNVSHHRNHRSHECCLSSFDMASWQCCFSALPVIRPHSIKRSSLTAVSRLKFSLHDHRSHRSASRYRVTEIWTPVLFMLMLLVKKK